MALLSNDGTPISIGEKSATERKDRYKKQVDRQRRRYESDPVSVCKAVLRGLERTMFNINHTEIYPNDLHVNSVEMTDKKVFVVVTANRTLDTLSEEDKQRMIGSELLTFAGADENNGLVYVKFKLSCMVNDNKED